MAIDIQKQFVFAFSKALTAVAKAAQANVLSSLRSTFTIRNTWLEPGNAMGIKVLGSTKTDLSAAVVTRASWLSLHEDDHGLKVNIRGGKYIAIPSDNVKRNKKDIITQAQRPRNLKNVFVYKGKSGRLMIAQKYGKGLKQIRILYYLVKEAHIPHKSTVVDPTIKTIEKEFSNIFFQELKNAIQTAR